MKKTENAKANIGEGGIIRWLKTKRIQKERITSKQNKNNGCRLISSAIPL